MSEEGANTIIEKSSLTQVFQLFHYCNQYQVILIGRNDAHASNEAREATKLNHSIFRSGCSRISTFCADEASYYRYMWK